MKEIHTNKGEAAFIFRIKSGASYVFLTLASLLPSTAEATRSMPVDTYMLIGGDESKDEYVIVSMTFSELECDAARMTYWDNDPDGMLYWCSPIHSN
jgi:hypothetical protein